MARPRGFVALVCALIVTSSVVWSPAAAALGRFAPPVDAAVVDGFRPPTTPYGPGNRGWEYDTQPGTEVKAAGAGLVSFAGPVGGSYAVTVAHGGGLRTSYSYLAAVAVRVGQRVELGALIGSTVDNLHFGVRLRDRYIDPALLFRVGGLRERARLLPSATLTGRLTAR